MRGMFSSILSFVSDSQNIERDADTSSNIVASGVANVGSVGNGNHFTPNYKRTTIFFQSQVSRDDILNCEFEFTAPTAVDSFSFEVEKVTQSRFVLRTIRTDAQHGWGQNLFVHWYLKRKDVVEPTQVPRRASRPIQIQGGYAHVGSVGNGDSRTSRRKSVLVNLERPLQPDEIGRTSFQFVALTDLDEFEFEGELTNEESFVLTTTRVDAPHGWGQDLRVRWTLHLAPPQEVSTNGKGAVSLSMNEMASTLVTMGFPKLSSLDCLDVLGTQPTGGMLERVVDYLGAHVSPSLSERRLVRSSSTDLLEHWAQISQFQDGFSTESAFAEVQHRIAISPRLMCECQLSQFTAFLESFASESNIQSQQSSFAVALQQLVMKVYSISEDEVPRQRVQVMGFGTEHRLVQESITQLYSDLGFGIHKKHLHYSLAYLSTQLDSLPQSGDNFLEVQNDAKIKLALLVRASGECMARKRQVVGTIIKSTVGGKGAASARSPADALRTACAEYIDGVKDKAFQSTFLEPSYMMFHLSRQRVQDQDVAVHGANTYAGVLAATLGVQVSHRPYLGDEVKGVCDFLLGASMVNVVGPMEAVRKIWSPDNLGKAWRAALGAAQVEAISRLHVVSPSYFILAGRTDVRSLVNDVCQLSGAALDRLVSYLDAFAHHFSEEVILEKLFTHLSSEEGDVNLPLLQDFFESEVLPKAIAQGGILKPDDELVQVREWVYDVENDYHFQPERARFLFELLDVVRKRTGLL